MDQRVAYRRRLVLEAVRCIPGDLSGVERHDQSFAIHERTARRVDQEGAVLHAGDLLRSDEVTRFGRQRGVQAQDVRAFEHLLRGQEREAGFDWRAVPADDVHSEGLRETTDGPADVVATENAEHGAPAFLEFKFGAVVPAVRERAGDLLVEAPPQVEDQRHRVLGDGRRRAPGSVEDRDAPDARGIEIDVVESDAAARDDPEIRARVEQVDRDLSAAASQDGDDVREHGTGGESIGSGSGYHGDGFLEGRERGGMHRLQQESLRPHGRTVWDAMKSASGVPQGRALREPPAYRQPGGERPGPVHARGGWRLRHRGPGILGAIGNLTNPFADIFDDYSRFGGQGRFIDIPMQMVEERRQRLLGFHQPSVFDHP